MKVVQIMPTISFGDAVSNDAITLRDIIASMGFETAIYAENVDSLINRKHIILHAWPLPELEPEDVAIYHLSIGSNLSYELSKLRCRKAVIYHNVTPSHFFTLYSSESYNLCEEGIRHVRMLADVFDYGLADSSYNKDALIEYGYRCPIDVLPIILPMEDYKKKPNGKITGKYNDGITNIMFLGRIAPNKKYEDVIAAFSCYQKLYNPDARLFLVGSDEGMENYRIRLDKYISRLGVRNVFFTGKVPFDEILAYYSIADVFLCMSEHEGFCVPLIEAMRFNVPVVAYASTAIPETLNGAGFLLENKNPLETAGVIDRVVTDKNLREEITAGQQKRLEDFSYERLSRLFKDYLSAFIGGGK